MTRELSEQVSAPGSAVPSTSPRKGFLINRNFALLAIGQAISNMGDFIFSTTLLVWVFVLTHSAGAVSGILIALTGLFGWFALPNETYTQQKKEEVA